MESCLVQEAESKFIEIIKHAKPQVNISDLIIYADVDPM